jgi:hypothetical protein
MTPAHAGFDQSSPKGVDLTGVWTIDPERSEDPEQALKAGRSPPKGERPGASISVGGAAGGFGGFGGPVPAGGMDREAMRERMRKTLSPSERIEIMQLPDAVELNLADRSVSCTSSVRAQVSLPDGGIADQTCGWDDNAFVVELNGRDGFRRTDRYATGDGKTLIVSTTIKGGRMPEIVFKSVYVRHESN